MKKKSIDILVEQHVIQTKINIITIMIKYLVLQTTITTITKMNSNSIISNIITTKEKIKRCINQKKMEIIISDAFLTLPWLLMMIMSVSHNYVICYFCVLITIQKLNKNIKTKMTRIEHLQDKFWTDYEHMWHQKHLIQNQTTCCKAC